VEDAEADPHRQRVDAGRHGEDDEDIPAWILPPFPPPVSRLPSYTSSADVAEQDEGEPVIVPLMYRSTVIPQGTRSRHQELEQSEVEGEAEGLAARDRPRTIPVAIATAKASWPTPPRSEKRQRVDRNLPGVLP